jgi:hypothetical protein
MRRGDNELASIRSHLGFDGTEPTFDFDEETYELLQELDRKL